jgi:hypothetical protein
VAVRFFEDDLTNLRHVDGAFDLLLDFGALNDLNQQDRDSHMKNVLPLTHPASSYLLLGFEKKLPSAEVEGRFGEYFEIECITRTTVPDYSKWPPGFATYLMTRKPARLKKNQNR